MASWSPTYTVHLVEPAADLGPTEPGKPTPEIRDVLWTAEAPSPDEARAAARAEWRRKHGDDPPPDTEETVTLGPDVCEQCEGTGKVPRYLPPGVIDPGPESALGSAREQTCRGCNGTGRRP